MSHPILERGLNVQDNQIKTIYFDLSDDDQLVKDQLITDSRFVKVNLKKIAEKKVKPWDIQQVGIGNCYFLSALSSILRRNPDVVNPNSPHSIIQFNADDTVTVSFYDLNNPSIRYSYKINATKIVDKNPFSFRMNQHKNEVIYLLEKAYALHRMMKQKKAFSEEAGLIIDTFDHCRNNLRLSKKFNEKKLIEESIKQTTDEIIKKNVVQFPKNSNPKEEIERMINIHLKNYHNYHDALKSGQASDVYTALLGVPVEKMEIKNESVEASKEIAEKLCSNLIPKLKIKEAGDFLKEVFGSENSPEAHYFSEVVEEQSAAIGFQFGQKIAEDKKNMDLHQLMKDFFKKLMAEGIKNTHLHNQVLAKLYHYVDQKFVYKRGTGRYTDDQIKFYHDIHQRLSRNQIVSIGTNEHIGGKQKCKGQTGESKFKGLVSNHCYEVVNCYERDGKKFLQLRNPWDCYARDYRYKTRFIGGQKTQVLSATTQWQIRGLGFFSKIKSLVHRVFKKPFSPRDCYRLTETQIQNPALSIKPSDKFEQNGYFDIELNDAKKRFSTLYATNDSIIMPAVISLLNFGLKTKGHVRITKDQLKPMISYLLIKREGSQEERNKVIQAVAVAFSLINDTDSASLWLKKLDGKPTSLNTALDVVKKAYSARLPELERISVIDGKIVFADVDLNNQSTYRIER